MKADITDLRIIHYPDPRLRQKCAPVTDFGPELAALAERMLSLMVAGEGVGLAASQLGILQRLIVLSPTGKREDARILVNPVIREPHGSVEGEEGCLSLPGIRGQVRRAATCRVSAHDLAGRPMEFLAEDLTARICQHETDHLNGILILDRFGPGDRMAVRKTARALESQFRSTSRARA